MPGDPDRSTFPGPHIAVWRALADGQRRDYEAKARRLSSRIAELEQELRDRPKEIVERYIDQGVLDEAQAEADRAFRSRENAWQALCEIRLLHREREPGRCRCGQRLDTCKIARIVDRYPGLEKWENDQIQRLRDHQDHRLPAGHPAVLDPKWQP
jgi:hypothetical protein